jgi:hypothetical protein
LVITPLCVVSPTGYAITYSITNTLPSYLTVNPTTSAVTLPSADKANENATFEVDFMCEVPNPSGNGTITSTTFNATGLLMPEIKLILDPSYVSTYYQVYGEPSLKITPLCALTTTGTGYNVTYTITSTVPSYMTVNADKSITLPVNDTAHAGSSFTINFSCQVPNPYATGNLKQVTFSATGKILPQVLLDVSPTFQRSNYTQFFGNTSLQIIPACNNTPSAGYPITYSIVSAPSYLTINPNKTVTLPSTYSSSSDLDFTVVFECVVANPYATGNLASQRFNATGTIL